MGLLHTKCVNGTLQLSIVTITADYTDRDDAVAATLQCHISYLRTFVIGVNFQFHFGGLYMKDGTQYNILLLCTTG